MQHLPQRSRSARNRGHAFVKHRSRFGEITGHDAAKYAACQHNETLNCTCSKCMANRQLAKEEMLRRGRTVIPDFCQRRWAYTPLEITPRQLSAEVAVAFLSLVRCGRWIDDETIGPLRRSAIPFTPKGIQFQRQLIDILLDNGLIAPSPDSPQSAFSKIWSKEACWNPKAVHWRLLVPNPPAFIRQLKSLVASTDWPDGWTRRLRAPVAGACNGRVPGFLCL